MDRYWDWAHAGLKPSPYTRIQIYVGMRSLWITQDSCHFCMEKSSGMVPDWVEVHTGLKPSSYTRIHMYVGLGSLWKNHDSCRFCMEKSSGMDRYWVWAHVGPRPYPIRTYRCTWVWVVYGKRMILTISVWKSNREWNEIESEPTLSSYTRKQMYHVSG